MRQEASEKYQLDQQGSTAVTSLGRSVVSRQRHQRAALAYPTCPKDPVTETLNGHLFHCLPILALHQKYWEAWQNIDFLASPQT